MHRDPRAAHRGLVGLPRFRRRLVRAHGLELPFNLLTRRAVLLLDLADQDLVIAFGLVELVIGQLAPFDLCEAMKLFPLALEDVLVHVTLLSGVLSPAC